MLKIVRKMMKIEDRNLTKMRSILTIMICAFAVANLQAQKKPKVGQIDKALKSADYETARTIADQASEFEKMKDDPKTWFARARTYMIIDTADANIVDNPMSVAMASFDKARELAGGDVSKLYTTDGLGLPVAFDQHVENYWAYYFNKGATAYGEEEFERAVESFEKAQMINPTDTNAAINGGLAAHNAQMYDAASRNYQKAIDNGVMSKDIYSLYISILTSEETQDLDKALEINRTAQELFESDKDLARQEINLLLTMGKKDEAKSNIEKQLADEPNNPDYHFSYGVLLEETGDLEGARNSYYEALKADENHFNANFNLGVMLINEANAIIKERNNLGISDADLKKAEELDPKIDAKLEAALPQWEKIHEIEPGEENAMTTLRFIYLQLKQTDKAAAIQDKIDAAGFEEDDE